MGYHYYYCSKTSTIMYCELPTLFSSAGRTRLLFVMRHQREPLSMRALARLASLSVCAAAHALSELKREKLVTRRRVGKETRFALNHRHELVPLLNSVCDAAERVALATRASSYGSRPREILRFCSETSEFLARAREQNDVA